MVFIVTLINFQRFIFCWCTYKCVPESYFKCVDEAIYCTAYEYSTHK